MKFRTAIQPFFEVGLLGLLAYPRRVCWQAAAWWVPVQHRVS